MSKLTVAARVLEKLQKAPNREAKRVVQYLRGEGHRLPPQAEEAGLYSVMINQVTDLLDLMQDLKEMVFLVDRFAEAQQEYEPGFPPTSPLTQSYFYPHLYFDQAYGQAKETIGSVCLGLARAFQWHPQRLALLENLCHSQNSIFLHLGFSGKNIKLRDLRDGRELVSLNYSGYRGQKGDLIYARLLPSSPVSKVEEMITTPYLLKSSLTNWEHYLERHPDLQHWKTPSPWNYWLEFIDDGYCGHRRDAVFLDGLPEQATPPAKPDAKVSQYSLAQRWAPIALPESEGAPAGRPHMLFLMDEREGTVCKVDQTFGQWKPREIWDWLERHDLPPAGSELWLDDAELHAFLSPRMEQVKCGYRETLECLEVAVDKMHERFADPSEVCVVRHLGHREASQLFRSAQFFMREQPWKTLDSETVLAFLDPQGKQWGLVVMGSAGEQFGLAFYSSVDDALAALSGEFALPVFGFSSASECLVPSLDLDLIERENLELPGGEYPWIFSPRGVSQSQLRDLEWLLRQVPQLAQHQQLIEEGRRRLGVIDRLQNDPLHGYASAFLQSWGKESELAGQLAFLLAEFVLCELKPKTSLDKLGQIQALREIGYQYLQSQARKRKLNFALLCNLPDPQWKLRKAEVAVARRLSRFVREEMGGLDSP
jgi:hypothetical protein